MDTYYCPCGESRCTVKKFAKQYLLECLKCGNPILNKTGDPIYIPQSDVALLEFTLFVYNNSRETIRTKYKDHPEALKEAMKTKDVQDEEQYKRDRELT